MTFAELITSNDAKHYRFGPISGRVDITEDKRGFNLKINHPEPFGYGLDRLNGSNWFGVSTYAPDWAIVNGEILVIMSLTGVTTPYNEKYNALFDTMSVKYLMIERGGRVIWETWTGEIPTDEIIEQAIC